LIIAFSIFSAISAFSANNVSTTGSFPIDITAAAAATAAAATAAGTDSRGRATTGTAATAAAAACSILGNCKITPRPAWLFLVVTTTTTTAAAKCSSTATLGFNAYFITI
jgi:hypothetical protein